MVIKSDVSTSTSSYHKSSWEFGSVVIGEVAITIPGFESIDSNKEISIVKQPSRMHSRKPILTKNLKMKQLQLVGGIVSSNQEIEEFAEELETTDVKEYANFSNKSTKFKINPDRKNPANAHINVGSLKSSGYINSKLKPSIISGDGKISLKYAQQVNTDKTAIRQLENMEATTSGFLLNASKEGVNLQIDEKKIGITNSEKDGTKIEMQKLHYELEAANNEVDGMNEYVTMYSTRLLELEQSTLGKGKVDSQNRFAKLTSKRLDRKRLGL